MNRTRQGETTKIDALSILRSALYYARQAGLVVTAWNDGGNMILRVQGVNYRTEPGSGVVFFITKEDEVVTTNGAQPVTTNQDVVKD